MVCPLTRHVLFRRMVAMMAFMIVLFALTPNKPLGNSGAHEEVGEKKAGSTGAA